MEVDTKENTNPKEKWKVSWVGYIRTIFSTLIRAVIYLVISSIVLNILTAISSLNLAPYQQELKIIAIAFVVFSLLLNLLYARSISLYYDDVGVWYFSGIFPWSKGVSGVKWANIDEATYKTGFLSWAFKSYEVTIRHKYTKSNEIVLPYIFKGNDAVMSINSVLESRGYNNIPNSITGDG